MMPLCTDESNFPESSVSISLWGEAAVFPGGALEAGDFFWLRGRAGGQLLSQANARLGDGVSRGDDEIAVAGESGFIAAPVLAKGFQSRHITDAAVAQ